MRNLALCRGAGASFVTHGAVDALVAAASGLRRYKEVCGNAVRALAKIADQPPVIRRFGQAPGLAALLGSVIAHLSPPVAPKDTRNHKLNNGYNRDSDGDGSASMPGVAGRSAFRPTTETAPDISTDMSPGSGRAGSGTDEDSISSSGRTAGNIAGIGW